MADAKKCDRCGEIYGAYERDELPGLLVVERVPVEDTMRCRGEKIKDLCPSCSEALECFMSMEPIDIMAKVILPVNDLPAGSVLCGAKRCKPTRRGLE